MNDLNSNLNKDQFSLSFNQIHRGIGIFEYCIDI